METKLLEKFYKNSPTAYSCQKAVFDDKGIPLQYIILDYNPAYKEMMGLHNNNVINQKLDLPTDWEEFNIKQCIIDTVIKEEQTQFTIYHQQKWLRIILFPIDGDIFGCIYFDITKEYLQDKDIEGFLKVNIDMLTITNTDGYFLRVNQASERVLGYKPEELEGKSVKSIVHEDDIPKTLEVLREINEQKNIFSFINRVRCKNGHYRYLEWHNVVNGNFIYSSIRDITDRRQLEKELFEKNENLAQLTEELTEMNRFLKTLAITDDLTGLYNRHYLDIKVEEEMRRADQANEPLSMIIIDLDFFKKVNDQWGHPVGDKVLKETAGLLKGIIRKSDILVRLGGEEFLIVLPNTKISDACIIAERIRITIEENHYPIAGHLTASLGVANKLPLETYNNWYERTDNALYKAKNSKRNCVVHSTSTLLV
ncbi:PAS domain S-box-containing protein/diguanylate cyclase (GGDEF)-like protein [Ureibacillus xyleni]|uniref:PAS domain S-box-containing protein/diguanylate cyclase (GGDEF)-like protein n=2 Tax=Ureibacillus xyleni TaxID=614648 RepID=A0A285RW23_9BACL|nr:PAS domain S-box-containing protein/diguanylate cyclase (GGDEF)-like protein [Ureibacillus xyleni]